MKILFIIVSVGFLAFNCGCKNNDLQEQNTNYLSGAYIASLDELKLAENAQLKTSNLKIKNIADLLIRDHVEINKQIRALAGQKEISLPTDIPVSLTDSIVKMNEEKGLVYDKHFEILITKKQNDFIILCKKISLTSSDIAIKSLFVGIIPGLEKNLDSTRINFRNGNGK